MRIVPGCLTRFGPTILLAGPVLGCGGGEHRVTGPPWWGHPDAVVTLLEVSPIEFVAGEEIAIDVTMHNPTLQPIRLSFTSGCILFFVVQDLEGNGVAPMDRPCTDNAPQIELSPGEKLTWRFNWDGTARQPNVYLPPGEYQVIGGLGASGLGKPTAPVRVRILAP